MKVKAGLHVHSGADKVEGRVIGYSVFELIDLAEAAGFQVLAHTCHRDFVWDQAWADYALEQGILLIPGVELMIMKGHSENHIVAVNCDETINRVKTFDDLKKYKAAHPDLLLIAAHPNFGLGASLGLKRLQQYWELFDAVENSWFYSRRINFNQPVVAVAEAGDKPMVATADLHGFNFFCLRTDYVILELETLTAAAVVRAVRSGNFINVTAPKKLRVLIKTALHAFALKIWNKLTKIV